MTNECLISVDEKQHCLDCPGYRSSMYGNTCAAEPDEEACKSEGKYFCKTGADKVNECVANCSLCADYGNSKTPDDASASFECQATDVAYCRSNGMLLDKIVEVFWILQQLYRGSPTYHGRG